MMSLYLHKSDASSPYSSVFFLAREISKIKFPLAFYFQDQDYPEVNWTMSSTNEMSIMELALGTESQMSDLQLLQSLGIDPGTEPDARTAVTNPLQGLTDVVKALAKDVSIKIGALGDRIDALETRT